MRSPGERDPDARRRDDHAAVRERDGLRERPREALRNHAGVGLAAESFAHDDELVAAEARHRVRGLERRFDSARDLDEQLVPGVVAEAVVDDLEPIDVEEQHRDVTRVARQPEQRLSEPVEQQRPVREPRERVVEGLVQQAVLGGCAVDRDCRDRGDAGDQRDVCWLRASLVDLVDGDHAEASPVDREDRHGPTRVQALGRGDDHDVAVGRVRRRELEATTSACELGIGGREQIRERRAQWGATRDALERTRRGLVDSRRSSSLGDITEVADVPVDGGLVDAVGRGALEPPPAPVRVADARLGHHARARMRRDVAQPLVDVPPVVGMQVLVDGLPEELVWIAPQQTSHRRAHVDEAPAGVADGDRVARVLDEGAELGLALPDLVVRAMRLVDQAHEAPSDESRDRDAEDAEDRGVVGPPHPDLEHDHHGDGHQCRREDQDTEAVESLACGRRAVTELAHRGMQHRCGEQRVRGRPHRIEPQGAVEAALRGESGVHDVADSRRDDPGHEQGRGRVPAGERERQERDRDEERAVEHRVRDRRDLVPRRAARRVDGRADDELPERCGDHDRDHGAVDEGVAAVAAGAREKQERGREERVGAEIDQVGGRHRRVAVAQHVHGDVPGDVARHEERDPGGEQAPRHGPARPVQRDGRPRAHDGDEPDEVPDHGTRDVVAEAPVQSRGGEPRDDVDPDPASSHRLPLPLPHTPTRGAALWPCHGAWWLSHWESTDGTVRG